MHKPESERTLHLHARLLMEKLLGCKLKRSEDAHHKDGNPFNNDPANLQVLTHKEHMQLHLKKSDLPRHERPARREYMKRWHEKHLHYDRDHSRRWRAKNSEKTGTLSLLSVC